MQRNGDGGRCSSGRARSGSEEIIYVSSGRGLQAPRTGSSGEPLPEDGYGHARRYTASRKLTSEWSPERYGDLFGLSTASVRPSFRVRTDGPRHGKPEHDHVPHRIARMALDGVKRVRVNTLDAVATTFTLRMLRARLSRCCRRRRLRYSSLQRRLRCDREHRRYVGWAAEKVPGFGAEISPEQADSCRTPPSRTACGVLTMFRDSAARPAGKPRPMRAALHAYMDWMAAEPAPARHRNQDEPQ